MPPSIPNFTLNNDVKIPMVGFGIIHMADPAKFEHPVADAIVAGYRRKNVRYTTHIVDSTVTPESRGGDTATATGSRVTMATAKGTGS